MKHLFFVAYSVKLFINGLSPAKVTGKVKDSSASLS